VIFLYLFYDFISAVLRNLTGLFGLAVPRNVALWVGIAVSFLFLHHVVNIGFGRSWGLWPQAVVVVLALAAVAFNLWQYGSVWGPALGLLAFLLLAYVLGYVGLSSLLAGVFAAPG
jgi:hypothetical protein